MWGIKFNTLIIITIFVFSILQDTMRDKKLIMLIVEEDAYIG